MLQNFSHSGLAAREHIWMLSKVPELDKFKYVIKDEEKHDLAEEVIEEFKYAVVPKLDELERGVIHGDVNEMNVIVGTKPGARALSSSVLKVCCQILEGVMLSSTDYRITGIIDFGDIQESYYVFELAIAMTYMMLMSGDPATGGLVLAGYTTLVSARLVQSLVLGAYTLAHDPSNSYVSSTEKANGWELLRKIRKSQLKADQADPTDWKTIANEYLTRS
ncbi:hypothetical protein MSG28_012569 [Choristoneura fumiferana]|uniref:Uncharacterized protein n=1 Tax=Choristoneura fumiferana TaxID=7141 RepID=A0ACC0JHA5_CHOFU|nr:hypothetical protein MSG28_012569 [Choristoneura fumiferana]